MSESDIRTPSSIEFSLQYLISARIKDNLPKDHAVYILKIPNTVEKNRDKIDYIQKNGADTLLGHKPHEVYPTPELAAHEVRRSMRTILKGLRAYTQVSSGIMYATINLDTEEVRFH